MNKLLFFQKKGYSVINLFTAREIEAVKKIIEKKILSQVLKFKQIDNFNYKNLKYFHRNKQIYPLFHCIVMGRTFIMFRIILIPKIIICI